MDYEWEIHKAKSNLRKHGINFADATTVFSDDYAMTIPDDDPDEQRFVTIGMDSLGRILVVAYTWRGERIRIISARKAESYECKQYVGTSLIPFQTAVSRSAKRGEKIREENYFHLIAR